MTQWPVHKQTHRPETKHGEQQDLTDIQNKLLIVAF